MKDFSFRSRKNSVLYAMNGLRILFREPNVILHVAITVIVIIAAVICRLTAYRWVALFLAIGLVWVTEAINTAIELLCDYSCDSKLHPAIKIIKDVSAAAVLIAAVISVVVGVVIFLF